MSSSVGIWVPILVAIVTALATVITVYLAGRANLRLEREKFDSNSQLERQKFEASLVLQAIATGEQETAQKNLEFLVKMGFLPDPQGKIKELADEPEGTPVLPAPSASDWVPAPIRPAKFRRAVRTGADPDVSLVKDTTVPTTVEELVGKPRPPDMLDPTKEYPAYQNRRAEDVERTVYQLEAEIIACSLQNNGHYYLLLRGASGRSMLATCPDPDPRFVDPSSRWVKEIGAVRSEIQESLQPGRNRKRMSVPVRITGVGFFNTVHGLSGQAPNGIELTPVLTIEWLSHSQAPAARAKAGRSRSAQE